MFSLIRLYRISGSVVFGFFVDRAWLDIPEPAELKRMNDYDSDIDIAMHVCHHQLYILNWEKRNENDQDSISWTRSEYVDYVAENIMKIPVVTKFLECFSQAATGPSRPVRLVETPNDQPRGPPETEDPEHRLLILINFKKSY